MYQRKSRRTIDLQAGVIADLPRETEQNPTEAGGLALSCIGGLSGGVLFPQEKRTNMGGWFLKVFYFHPENLGR